MQKKRIFTSKNSYFYIKEFLHQKILIGHADARITKSHFSAACLALSCAKCKFVPSSLVMINSL